MPKCSLDLLDRKLLYELDLNSRATYQELAKKLRVAKETIRFRIVRLVDQKYIKNFITTTNTSLLNRFYYKLFYKFHKTNPIIDKEIVQFIQNYHSVAYFASVEGRYDVTFLLLAKDMHDLYQFLIPFRQKFGDYILEQEILTLPAVHRFNFRFFYEPGKTNHTQYPLKLREPNLNALDYQVIKQLALNSRISLVELGKITKTDSNVVKYHMKKLRKNQILGTHVLDINFEKFGVQHFQIDFILRNHSSINRIIHHVSLNPKSTFATVTLGKYDLAVEYVVETMKELREILNDIRKHFSEEIVDHDVFILYEHSVNWFPYELERS